MNRFITPLRRALSCIAFFAALVYLWHFLVQRGTWSSILLPDPFLQKAFAAVWEDQLNLADPATMMKLADDSGLPGKQLVERSGADAVSAIYEQNRQDALTSDVFGSPAYVLDGEVFWGQDRIELLADAAGMRGEEDDAIAEAGGLADVVGDEDDGFFADGPDFLDVAVELLAGQGVEGGEGLVHEEDAGIRGEGAREGGALFHAAGKLVDIRGGKALEAD